MVDVPRRITVHNDGKPLVPESDSETTSDLSVHIADGKKQRQHTAPGVLTGSPASGWKATNNWWRWIAGGICGGVVIVIIVIVVLVVVCKREQPWWMTSNLRAKPGPLGTKPSGDSRLYQYAQLGNGIEVINVRDATALTSAYSVAVQAGSFDDPRELPGLAHFCEHMLFLGTKSFPEPSGYDNFVNKHSGYLNAYTAPEATVYFTELSQAAAAEGLARFADFFRAPLFTDAFVEKEVHAIDSEHAKNVQDPAWRLQDLMYSLANPKSPVSFFHTGDVETLFKEPQKRGISPVTSLRTWFDDHYCSQRLRLVTVGPEPLDVQISRAEKEFGNISTGSQACQKGPRNWATPTPWPTERLGKWVMMQGTQPQAEMAILFFLPDQTKQYKSQAAQYIQYVLAYGGEGSAVEEMRDTLGLVTDMGAFLDTSSAGSILWVEYTLTDKGRKFPSKVLDMLFSYIAKVRANGVDAALYRSLANVSKLEWDWAPQQGAADTASTLSERLTRLPHEDVLSGDALIQEFDLDLVQQLLDQLHPNNAIVGFVSDDEINSEHIQVLPHYNITHAVRDLEAQFGVSYRAWNAWLRNVTISASSAQLRDLHQTAIAVGSNQSLVSGAQLPSPLLNVPTDVSGANMHAQLGPDVFGSRPIMAGNEANEWLWYRGGWVTLSPKVQLNFLLRPTQEKQTPMEPTAVQALALNIYTSILTDVLSPKMYDTLYAGASADVALSPTGIALSFKGYPSQLEDLTKKVMFELQHGVTETSDTPYQRVVERARNEFRTYSDMPVQYAMKDRNILLTSGRHSQEEMYAALGNMSLKQVAASVRSQLLETKSQRSGI
mmetsp:Transcript_126986/g.283017  ORF Transcript_126986/g.283017 Transcript_126986/m.283017 type:complete len:832 (-) Transcript_126986:4-2499(-)